MTDPASTPQQESKAGADDAVYRQGWRAGVLAGAAVLLFLVPWWLQRETSSGWIVPAYVGLMVWPFVVFWAGVELAAGAVVYMRRRAGRPCDLARARRIGLLVMCGLSAALVAWGMALDHAYLAMPFAPASG
ncbi:hypothetical protein [Dyella sp.]|uniref:hypothetical protein n=1 Tax=Dyella sp. TaxID=1869338 RepID=UPI002D777331|nr:hypothetical protein [Dyella sp.]HET6432474.1 hypothetical protein [Dyella sp.]